MKAMPFRGFSLLMVPLLAALSLIIGACSSGGSDGVTTIQPPPLAGGSATITGTVSGTVIKALNASTGAVLAETDTASQPGPPPFPFSLPNIPIGVPIKVFFFSAGQTFPLYFGVPPNDSNVFSVQTAGAITLGPVTMDNGRATAQTAPGNLSLGPADSSVPGGVAPPPATLAATSPAPASGSVIVSFAVQNFSIGGEGQQHLHIYVDGIPTRHFFNGQSNKVVDSSGQLTNDVQWESSNSFRLNGLSVGQHQVTVKLATAADVEFANRAANPPAVTVTITSPPSPLATLAITSPSPGASLPFGPIDISFTVQNFTIGGQGEPHLHISLDGGPANHFFNGTTNQVLDGSGQPVANIARLSATSFRVMGLSSDFHAIRLALADTGDQDLQNAEANPPTLNFSIQAPPVASAVTVTNPSEGQMLASSPVTVSFAASNFTIGVNGTSHLHFYLDGDPVVYEFFDGPGIDEDNGVLYNGVHTHSAHWKTSTSFALFGLAAGTHQVRFVLADASHTELVNAEASTTRTFSVISPPSGDLRLQSVLSSLDFPVGLSLAPDGRIFYNERFTGKIRVISPSWQLDPTPFCQISIATIGEQGLLGLTLDPTFSATNESVYVYYTAPGETMNRVSRLTKSGDVCTETIVLDNLPVYSVHNGGIIQFGPDLKLYVVIGDVLNLDNSQDLTSLAGKILRVNPDGSAPADNPFFSHPNPNAKKVFSYGHRNSYGFTFHPQTHHLWESENGPADNDEINRIIPGGNYGWSLWGGIVNQPGFVDPILAFNPVIAPTGIVAIPGNSTIYPSGYRNNLLVAVWNDGTIRHIVLTGPNLDNFGGTSVAYPGGQGGLLSFMLGSDGYIYVSSVDGIFRIVPH